MGSRDKRTEEMIAQTMEEAMRGILDDHNKPETFRRMDDRDEAVRRKSSGRKSADQGTAKKRPSGKRSSDNSADSGRKTSVKKALPKEAAADEIYEEGSGEEVQKEASDSPKKRKPRKKDPDRTDVSADEGISGSGRVSKSEEAGSSGDRRNGEAESSGDRRNGEAESARDRRNGEAGIAGKGGRKSDSRNERADDDDWESEYTDDEDSREEDGRDEDSREEDVRDEEDQRGRRRRTNKTKYTGVNSAARAAAGVLGTAAAAYIGFAVFFNSHFMFNTKINGMDCSMKSVEQVEDYMKKQVSDYTLTLEESQGGREAIHGSAIAIEYVPGGQLEEFMEEQENFLWPKSLWKHPEIKMEIGVKYDETALAEAVAGLGCMNPETQTPSTDAHPQFQDGQFVVAPEIVGTQINTEVFHAKVAEAISGFRPSLDLAKSGCYALPRFLSDSPEVVAAKDAMNSYLGANVTYDFNPHTEVVDASVISQWVTVDAEMNVAFNQEAVRAYVQSLADKYNTKGRARSFTTATGNVVTVEGGGYGWQIDQEAEFNALLANVQNGETVTREANFSSRGASHGDSDVGSTYAEVDLTNQRMYFIQNGQVVLQSDCVTGNPNRGNATPQGWYSLAWKQRNRTLRGTKRPDGTYEYETPVKYWMPFNGGIGFHDASWQASFGGQRYRTHGSHGCVNLPTSVAGQLYELLMDGMPVICHY